MPLTQPVMDETSVRIATPRAPVLSTADVAALRRLMTRGGAERTALLQAAGERPIRSAKALREWHELLLFVLAHPRDEVESSLASAALDRVSAIAAQLQTASSRAGDALTNSGIAGAPVEGSYSLALLRWLLRTWPAHLTLTQVDAPLDEVRDVLRTLVLPVEEELVDWPVADADELLASLFGPSRHRWISLLVAALDALDADERVREHLFARLRVYVRIDGAAATCSVTKVSVPTGATFFLRAGAIRSVDVAAIASMPAPRPVRLSAAAAQGLIDTARTVLATMERETDPVTHAGTASLFDMGRGLRIALYSLSASHRLAFDSYVGFMAFRNGVPLAYGGAWIFPGRSKIGINVFPAQRGGESAWCFAQLLRLYRSEFRVDRFEAENYQLGHGNAEGLRSGAYWFYYRLGFRPMTPALRRVAEREFGRLSRRSGYAVPRPVLLELVEAGLELVLRDTAGPVIDTSALTEAAQRLVVQRHDGDRARAMSHALRRVRAVMRSVESPASRDRWTAAEKHVLHLWALPLDLVDDLEAWPPAERQRLALLVRAKAGATETRHQRLLRKHRRLLSAWQSSLQSAGPP